ncbi:hypothetical protein VKS41_001813 [Umbelopsis sp. WA50703]
MAGDDFSPCFRQIVIDAGITGAVAAVSAILLFAAVTKYYRRHNSGYQPLKSTATTSYGAVDSSSQHSSVIEEEEDYAESEDTLVTSFDNHKTFTIFDATRFLAMLLAGFSLYNLVSVINNHYDSDSRVESDKLGLIVQYAAGTLVWMYATLLAFINVAMSRTNTLAAYGLRRHLNLIYFVTFLVSVVDARSFYLVRYTDIHTTGYLYALDTFFVTFALLLVIINERFGAPTSPIITKSGRPLSTEAWASLYSQFMFTWLNPMMKEGYRKTLNDTDLLELPPFNRASNILSSYRKHKRAHMLFGLFHTFRRELFLQFFYSMGWSIFLFGPPYFLNKIIKSIENPATESNGVSLTPFLFVLGLFITSCTQSLLLQQALYIGRTLGIRIQAIVIGEVYAKALKRRDNSGASQDNEKKDDSKDDSKDDKKDEKKGDKVHGNINNLLSVDAQKVAELAAYIFYLYTHPCQILFCIWGLYKLLGVSAFFGVVVIIVTFPLPQYLTKLFEKNHKAVMAATDSRLKIMNELLGAIRIVKFFAWEKEFKKRVEEARTKELKCIRGRLMIYMWSGNVWFLIPILIMVAVFYVYTLGHSLSASTAFTTVALFQNLRGSLDELPFIISFLFQAKVSLERIDTFLGDEEVEENKYVRKDGQDFIGFRDNATFQWFGKPDASASGTDSPARQAQFTLKNLNLSFPQNKLSIVCGPTGSGKTTLLSSLLGETACVSGSAVLPRNRFKASNPIGGAVSGIAYVAQSAWLQNASIKDNILFGLPFDEDRYEKVLYMCALTRDLEILEHGDATEVGEKGITLSGGQKQRLAIARAVYSQADVIVLDDCLSAVDAHTAKHLYDHCLMGDLMQNRTRILVTHHVGLCLKGADYIVALQNGEVAGAGHPLEVVKTGVLGEELANIEEEVADAAEGTAVEGKVPELPKKVGKKDHKDGDGKLTQDEVRAEGSVSLTVWKTYFEASGGTFFWLAVLFMFCVAQFMIIGQDYWIKVWAGAYSSVNSTISDFAILTTGGQYRDFITMEMNTPNYFHQLMHSAGSVNADSPQNVNVNYYLGIYFLIGVVTMFFASLRNYILYMGSLEASKKIHNTLINRILRAKVRFFDVTPLGRIINRFSSDMETIDQNVAPSGSFLLNSIVATAFVVLLISWVTPLFLVPGCIIAAIFWFIGTFYLESSRDMKRLNSVSRSPIYVQFNESVNGVATIRAFGAQSRFVRDNMLKIDSNNRPFIWMWATNRWLHCRVDILGAFVGFCTGFVIILGRSWIDPGMAGLSLSYALTFTHNVLWVVRMYAVNEMNLNAIERVQEYLDVDEEPAAVIEETRPRDSWPETGSIEVDNLVMQYTPENPPVLRDLSFAVKPREKIGIVGRTGSGKSTFALSLFRFMEPTSGTIKIDGIDISKIGLEDLRSRLTIIPQDPVLFSGTLRSNLDPFGHCTDEQLWAALKRSHLVDENDEPNELVSLDSSVSENGSNWSQGQRQLIALARALVKKTSLIILDEATSSVDFDTDHKIQQTIRSEFQQSALLCIAHRIRTVADYDRILVLDHGRLLEFDHPYTLMTKENGHFMQMCQRSGEYNELLSIAKGKWELDNQ